MILRQDSAASQRLFDAQLEAHGLTRDDLDAYPPAPGTEEELAIALHDSKAEAGLGWVPWPAYTIWASRPPILNGWTWPSGAALISMTRC